MVSRLEDIDADFEGQTRGRTTIELRRDASGEWLATQSGVDAVGKGRSAAAAAAAYCGKVDARLE